MEDPEFDFYSSISDKVIELEKRRDEVDQYIGFAKTIKMTGMMPNTKQVGTVRFEDFIKNARENWNFYSEPETIQILEVAEKALTMSPEDWELEDYANLGEVIKSFADDYKGMVKDCTINAYYKLLSRMQSMEYQSDVVQTIVKMLYEYLCEQHENDELSDKFTPQFFARYTAPTFLTDSDIGYIHERNYGTDVCLFIADAIAFFGGYDSADNI